MTQRPDQQDMMRQVEAAEAKARRSKITAIVVIAVVIVAIIVGAIFMLMNRDDGSSADPTAKPTDPSPTASVTTSVTAANAQPGGIVYTGDGQDAPASVVVVSVYFDYMCPYCGEFERANGKMLEQYASEGKIAVDYHPLTFLDRLSQGTEFSTRASAAAWAVGSLELEKYPDFNLGLFNNQPQENTAGLSDEKIAQIAKEAGVSQSTIDQFGYQRYKNQATQTTTEAMNGTVTSTPSVFIDKKKYELQQNDLKTADGLSKAIDAAIAAKK